MMIMIVRMRSRKCQQNLPPFLPLCILSCVLSSSSHGASHPLCIEQLDFPPFLYFSRDFPPVQLAFPPLYYQHWAVRLFPTVLQSGFGSEPFVRISLPKVLAVNCACEYLLPSGTTHKVREKQQPMQQGHKLRFSSLRDWTLALCSIELLAWWVATFMGVHTDTCILTNTNTNTCRHVAYLLTEKNAATKKHRIQYTC